MAPVAVYDACVPYPNALRDLLLRIAQTGLVQAKWSDQILDEVFRNLRANRPDLDPRKLDRTRRLMVRAVRDCLVVGHEALIPTLRLPDGDDCHVLAAAIRCRADSIVTRNLKDFPARELAPWNVEARHPDDFVMDLVRANRPSVYAAVQQIADSWRSPAGTTDDVLDRLEKDGLIETAAALRL